MTQEDKSPYRIGTLLTASDSLLPPRYVLQQLIGKGGSSEVFKASSPLSSNNA